jgi:hypothetical protein
VNRIKHKIFPGLLIYFTLLILGLFFGCAKIANPGGGPVDKTSPDIISIKPDPGSVAVDPGGEIEIIFSKNMNKETTEKAVFISPLFFNYPTYEWSGKKLKIRPPEKLKPNTTYSITIGASAVDTHNNKLGKSKSFSFSTGERVNSGKIEGRILMGALSGMDAWAYRLDSLPPDTFMYLIPDYITQTDSLGGFSFEFLGRGKYLIIGVDDKNNNQFWTPPSEKIALPSKLIELPDDSAIVGGLVLVAAEQDTAKPIFSKVTSANVNSINIQFSHQMKENSIIRADAFKIIPIEESLAQSVIFRVYPLNNNLKVFQIDCGGMISGKKYKLEGRNLESIFSQTSDSLSQIFTAGSVDTISLNIADIFPEQSEKPYIAGFEIALYFTESINQERFKDAISIKDGLGNAIKTELTWRYPNQIIIKPEMKDAEDYIMSVDGTKIIDMQGNRMGDSVVTYKYITSSSDTLGQLAGRIVDVPGDNIVVMVYPLKGDTVFTRITGDGYFKIDRLYPSTYRICAYWDMNLNNKLDIGKVKPVVFSEPVAIYDDTVAVRSRWEIDIGQVDFNWNLK